MKFSDLLRRRCSAPGVARRIMPGAVFLALFLSLFLALFSALFSGASPAFAQESPSVMDDVREPEQLAPDLERSEARVVLLHFWASWCIPCRQEMRSLADFRRQKYPDLAERGLRVLTVSNDVRDKDLERFAAAFELAFPLYYDPYSRLSSRYGVRGLPSTVVLDGDGEVVDQILGGQDWLGADFNRHIKGLLRDQGSGRELDLTVEYNTRR